MAHPNGVTPIPRDEHQPAPRAPKRTASDSSDSTMNSTATNDLPSSPTKRRCTSPSTTSESMAITTTTNNNKNNNNDKKGDIFVQLRSSQISLHSIIHLPESALWSLCKSDVRNCFLALQSYARSPYPLSTVPNSLEPTSHPTPPVPALLRLPLEIRQQIYSLLIPAPVSSPIRGPHPRQLQNPLRFTQPIPAHLLLLNHQIRQEALPVFYGAHTQTAYVVIDYNLWAHKTKRSDLVISSLIPSSLRHIHVTLSLGSEKRPLISPSSSHHSWSANSSASSPNANNSAPQESEASTRLLEIKKGIKKLLKWLSGADIKTLTISWQEPPQTYPWTQKMEVLERLRGMRAVSVMEGEINWGLEGKGKWNRGRRFRWEDGWIKCLERGRGADYGS